MSINEKRLDLDIADLSHYGTSRSAHRNFSGKCVARMSYPKEGRHKTSDIYPAAGLFDKSLAVRIETWIDLVAY